jgi:hypothetical protein
MGLLGVRHAARRRGGSIAALVVLAAALAGCSSLPATPSFSSLFGSGNAAANSNASTAYAPQTPANFECPDVTVRQGAATMTFSANPAEPTALNLRYQVGISTTARECRVVGTTVAMKVGVQGRIILGPAGAPGQFDVPLRLAVVREGIESKTIATKLVLVSVTIQPNDHNVLFSHVEDDVIFPVPPGNEIDSYVVYVGFDPLGARDLERKKPVPRNARPRRQS